MSNAVFYAQPAAWGEGKIDLESGEARHLNVLRANAGDEIKVIDGIGQIATCRLAELSKRKAVAEILAVDAVEPPQSRAIMALALSKATRRGFFLEKAVELGCAAIWIWQAENSQGRIPRDFAANARGQLVAGAKQCLNPWLPDVRVLGGAREVAQNASGADYRILPWECQEGQPGLSREMLGRVGTTVYVIGPEGGFAPDEIDIFAQAGFVAVSLGPRVLRCETAAVLCLGLHYWASQA